MMYLSPRLDFPINFNVQKIGIKMKTISMKLTKTQISKIIEILEQSKKDKERNKMGLIFGCILTPGWDNEFRTAELKVTYFPNKQALKFINAYQKYANELKNN